MSNLYEVEFKNRVVKKFSGKPLYGRQGRWYPERCLVVAEGEHKIMDMIYEKLTARRILGVRRARLSGLKREVKITDIRRIA